MTSVTKKGVFAFAFVASVAFAVYSLHTTNAVSEPAAAAPVVSGNTVAQADALLKSGKTAEAVALLEAAVKKETGDENILIMLGDIYTTAKLFGKATAIYQQALKANPSSGRAYTGLGLVALKQANVAGAVQNFETAMKAEPSRPEPYFHMGSMALGSNKLDVAMGFFQKALAVDKNHRPTLTVLAQIRQVADKARAAKALQK